MCWNMLWLFLRALCKLTTTINLKNAIPMELGLEDNNKGALECDKVLDDMLRDVDICIIINLGSLLCHT